MISFDVDLPHRLGVAGDLAGDLAVAIATSQRLLGGPTRSTRIRRTDVIHCETLTGDPQARIRRLLSIAVHYDARIVLSDDMPIDLPDALAFRHIYPTRAAHLRDAERLAAFRAGIASGSVTVPRSYAADLHDPTPMTRAITLAAIEAMKRRPGVSRRSIVHAHEIFDLVNPWAVR